jgi:exonuclease III
VITWNVARRQASLTDQAAQLAFRAVDVVALQEVTARTLPLWKEALGAIGLPHVQASLDGADPAREPRDRRRTGVLLAAREPLNEVSGMASVPWPETSLGATIEGGGHAVRVECVHVPNAANGWVKVRTLQGLRATAAESSDVARIFCGDFNTPRRELPTGEVVSFACTSRGRLRPERGPEWDAAELSVVPGLAELGYRDAFRVLHGYASPEPSWSWRRIAGHDGGWRLDHIFASAELAPLASTYHHDWRDAGLSDHSALEADLADVRRRPRGRPSP